MPASLTSRCAPTEPAARPAPASHRSRALSRRATSAALGTALGAALLAPSADATQHFVSRTDLAPPTVHVTTKAHGTAPGLIFVAPKGGKYHGQAGPMIYDNAGKLVYFKRMPKGISAYAFRAQTYLGKPVLTWWQGKTKRGYGAGEGEIYDQAYHKIATVRAGNGQQMDIHEFKLTPQGTALIDAYKVVHQDTSSAKNGSKDDLAMMNTVQEIDIATGKVVFEWVANEHIAPSETYETEPKRKSIPFDYIHVNSVTPDSDGNLLISARATHTIYKVDRKTGAIIWRLGGKKSDFKMGKGSRTRWQHDARRQADGTITAFDNNANEPTPGRETRGVRLRVDEAARTASLVRAYTNPKPQLSPSQGNVQVLPNGNVFMGWGGTAQNVTEFSPSGKTVRFEARFTDHQAESYRGFRLPWSAQPTAPPNARAKISGKSTAVYASWNGATTVASWRVLGGSSESSLKSRATHARTGFETRLHYGTHDKVVEVEALDAKGNVLGTTKTKVTTPSHRTRTVAISVAVGLVLAGATTGGVLVRRRGGAGA